MATQSNYAWRRDKDGLGVWEHRGKVAVAGYGHSPVDRRWDGVSMDKTLGAYSILACQKAMDDAGVTPEQIDGIICCDSHIAGASGGVADLVVAAPPALSPALGILGQRLVVAAAARTRRTTPRAPDSGRCPGGITVGMTSLTSSRTISIASNTAAHTMIW